MHSTQQTNQNYIQQVSTIIWDGIFCTSQIEASTSPPPGNPPGIWIFGKFLENSPLTGPKSCSNTPTPGKIARLLF